MSPSPVRIQLPAGDAFVTTLVEAADASAQRAGYAEPRRATLTNLVHQAALVSNDCDATAVELRFTALSDDQIDIEVQAIAPTRAANATLTKAFLDAAKASGAKASVDASLGLAAFSLPAHR